MGTHGHYLIHTTLPATTLLFARVTAAELIHEAATVTFNNPHIARAINAGCQLIKTKRKRRRIPYSAQYTYTNESLNRDSILNLGMTNAFHVLCNVLHSLLLLCDAI